MNDDYRDHAASGENFDTLNRKRIGRQFRSKGFKETAQHCAECSTRENLLRKEIRSTVDEWSACASDSQSGDHGFKSHSHHLLDLFSVVPSSNPWPRLYLANWLPPASWVFNPVMLYLNYLFLSI